MASKLINLDIGLAVLCSLSRRGQTLSFEDIADVCDCSSTRIQQIEKQALNKLGRKIKSHLYLYDFIRPDIELDRHQLS